MLIETAGNQRYIYATNRLGENAGASELIFRAGTVFVMQAIKDIAPTTPYAALAHGGKLPPQKWVENLLSIAKQNPLETSGVEVVVSTSGKALLLTKTRNIAEAIVRFVSLRVLKDCPGLTAHGVILPIGETNHDGNLSSTMKVEEAHKVVKDLHEQSGKVRHTLPATDARFPLNAFTQQCHSSSLPAQAMAKKGEDTFAYSAPIIAKRIEGENAFARIDAGLPDTLKLSNKVSKLDGMEQLDWLAVVHADGNGFGKLFIDLGINPQLEGKTARDYFNLYREFSCSMELCGLQAFGEALKSIKSREVTVNKKKVELLPLVPLVLGGDDLTVILDGRQAIGFTKTYLEFFELATTQPKLFDIENVIPKVSAGALGAGAGIAIIKPHHPFHAAYELAEDLLKQAKKTKKALGTPSVSAFDFHILFDGGATRLKDIREELVIIDNDKKQALFRRPYIVGSGKPHHEKEGAQAWMDIRLFETVQAFADALNKDEEDEIPGLPRSQQHMLRDMLFYGASGADAQYELIKNRYNEFFKQPAVKAAIGKGWFQPDPLHDESDGANNGFSTMLIDAMDLNDIAPPKNKGEDE